MQSVVIVLLLVTVPICAILDPEISLTSSTTGESVVSSLKSTRKPPLTGFIRAETELGTIGINVIRKINKPFHCNSIEFVGVPANISSPLMGGSKFRVIEEELYNDRLAWTNGKETLSYAETGEHGTWIVGNEPGQDSGYVYIKPKHISLIPVDLEHGGLHWHWLIKKKWAQMTEVRVVCADPEMTGDSFYEAEYWDPTTREAIRSHLSYMPDMDDAFLFDKEQRNWLQLNIVETVCVLGRPVMINDPGTSSSEVDELDKTSKNKNKNLQKATAAILVNEEHSSTGWSLTFRRIHDSADLAAMAENNRLWDYKDEIRFVFSTAGIMKHPDDFTLRPLNLLESRSLTGAVKATFSTVQRGDYVWAWYHSKGPALNHTVGPLPPGLKPPEPKPVYAFVEEHTEVLLWCMAKSATKAIFRFYVTDRRDIMNQGTLSRDTDYFIVDLAGFDGSTIRLDAASSSLTQEVALLGVVHIGPDPVSFLRRHLEEKEGVLGGMSSCYFYHAAVSIPAPLVYAAEMVCVLLGAKPVTMIQYQSASDEQWKFPLVADISSSVMAAKQILGSSFDVDYRVHTYGDAVTLILYRRSRKYIVDNLLPRGLSQALHPMPYPDSQNPEPDWRDQIYFAWWNGFLLGYPERFVDNYCTSFHNDLSEADKVAESRRAKDDMKFFLRSIGQQPELIRMGLDPPVTDDFWPLIQYT